MSETALPGLRWGRALVAALAVEVVALISNIVVRTSFSDSIAVLDVINPILLFLLFILAGSWCAKGSTKPIANGFITGVWGVILFLGLSVALSMAGADLRIEDNLQPLNLLVIGLKLAGGMIGGWLVLRKSRR